MLSIKNKELVRRVLSVVCHRHALDVEQEMVEVLGVLSRKAGVFKVNDKKVPLPFNGVMQTGCCKALEKNHGLYTPCNKKLKSGDYCAKCTKKMTKKGLSVPAYGTIEDRMKCGMMDYVCNGDKVKSYVSVLRKMNLNVEEVKAEAEMLRMDINPIHWEVVAEEKTKKGGQGQKKGRPRKAKVDVEVAEPDSFEAMVEEVKAQSLVLERDEFEKIVENAVENAPTPVPAPAIKPPSLHQPIEKIMCNGRPYLRKNGEIYSYEEYEETGQLVLIGHWDDTSDKIMFKDEEYDSSDEEVIKVVVTCAVTKMVKVRDLLDKWVFDELEAYCTSQKKEKNVLTLLFKTILVENDNFNATYIRKFLESRMAEASNLKLAYKIVSVE